MTPGAKSLCAFAVKRGDLKKRIDVHYNLPEYTLLEKQLRSKFADRLKPLGEIADVICGPFGSAIKNTDYRESGIPLVRITNISKDGYMNYDDLIFLSEELGERLCRTQVTEGDIVISQRGSLGQCAVVDGRYPKMNISANIIAVKNIRESSASFIHDYLLSVVGQALLARNASGQVQQKITTQDIADVPIPLGCDEKHLSGLVRSAYSSYSQKIAQTDSLLRGMSGYIHEVLDLDEVEDKTTIFFAAPRGNVLHKRMDPEYHRPFYAHRIREIEKAPHDTLGNIVEFSNETWNQKDYFASEFPYIEISGVRLRENVYETVATPLEEAPSRANMIVRRGEIIVSATRPHRGAIATITCPDGEMEIASTGFCVLRRLRREDVSKEYLQWILLDDYVLLQMLRGSSGGNYPAITGDELKKIVIPIPDPALQKKICEEAARRKDAVKALRGEAAREWQAAKTQFEKDLFGGQKK